ncbi:BCL-6 corepressor, partial [Elysia marginata]
MSLGRLPPLPSKATFTSRVHVLDEHGQGDVRRQLSSDSDVTLVKTNGVEVNDLCAFHEGLPEKGVWNSPHNISRYQIQSPEPSRSLQDRRTDSLPDAKPVNQDSDKQHPEGCPKASNKTNDVDAAMAMSPITRAIIRGEHSLVLESLKQGENPNTVCSKSGHGYLHIISWQASNDTETALVPMVYQLSNAGIDLNHKDKSGFTAARVAIRRKLVQVLTALLKCGADLGVAELEETESVRGMIRNDMLEVVRRFYPGYWEAVLDPNPFKVLSEMATKKRL